MEFYPDEIEEIKQLVKEHRLNGNVYIAYCDNSEKIPMEDLAFFQNDFSANEYCYENRTDRDRYAITTTGKILERLDAQLQERQLDNLKSKIMKQENLEYLQGQIKNAGFGEALDEKLVKMLESNKELNTTLTHSMKLGEDKVDAVLNFRYSPDKDMHYFNSYDLKVIPQEGSNKVERKRTFYVSKDNNFSVDEAYNLLNHRFVNKDMVSPYGEKTPDAWVGLNFKETDNAGNFKITVFPQKYNFNLDTALDKFPLIKELGIKEDREALIASLKKGNKAEITLVRDGKEEKGAVVTNAYRRSVYVTDAKGKKVDIPSKTQSQSQSNDQSQKNGTKKDLNNEQKQDAGSAQAKDAKNDQKANRNKRKGLHA